MFGVGAVREPPFFVARPSDRPRVGIGPGKTVRSKDATRPTPLAQWTKPTAHGLMMRRGIR